MRNKGLLQGLEEADVQARPVKPGLDHLYSFIELSIQQLAQMNYFEAFHLEL
jgi:hypothetical protein